MNNLTKDVGISINKYNKIFHETTLVYLNRKFKTFDLDKLMVSHSEFNKYYQDLKYSYSHDNVEWSAPVISDNFFIEEDSIIDGVWIAIWFEKHKINENLPDMNYDDGTDNLTTFGSIQLHKIQYDDIEILWDDLKIKVLTNTININPVFNMYDNQDITLKRWNDSNYAITRTKGLNCVYFKTTAVLTNHTLSNNYHKNVVSIKSLKFTLANPDAPQDRLVFNEWDMGLPDEFVIQVMDKIFKDCFGYAEIPLSDDYLYIPLFKKLYKVITPQPRRGHLAQIGWWELYLGKFEDSESVTLSDELMELYSDNSNFDYEHTEAIDVALNDFMELKNNTVVDTAEIISNTNEEKKNVTQNYTNKLVDSTSFLSLKTTESFREFYEKRLKIVSVNPNKNLFPITMYCPEEIKPRSLALTYNLIDVANIQPQTKSFQLTYNFVLREKFSGELIDVGYRYKTDDVKLLTIRNSRNKYEIIIHHTSTTLKLNYDFIIGEFYQITYINDIVNDLIKVNISILNPDNSKETVFEKIYDTPIHIIKSNINSIMLYGGTYLINDIEFSLNGNKIFQDNCNPVLIMNKYGTL